MTRTVLIASYPFGLGDPAPRELLESRDVRLVWNPHERKLRPEELRPLLAGVEAVIASTEPYDEETLAAAPDLKLIARTGVGMDSVDLEACRRRGVMVAWTPDAPSDSVAELTVGLLVTLARQVVVADRALRAGGWDRRTGWLLRERTVGIVGFGRIGTRVARLLKPFGCRLLATDIDPTVSTTAAELGVELVSQKQLLAESHAVTLHVPLTDLTRGLLGSEALEQMQPGALLLNTARGEVVDEDALLESLQRSHLGGAALDVFHHEPYRGPLAGRDDVLLTCHMGSCSDRGRLDMELGAAQAVADWIDGLDPPERVV